MTDLENKIISDSMLQLARRLRGDAKQLKQTDQDAAALMLERAMALSYLSEKYRENTRKASALLKREEVL